MRTNYLLNALLLCLIWLPIGSAESSPCKRSTARQPNISKQSPSLQLTMKIIRQTYCPGDSELDGLGLDVMLTYTNTGKEQLILYKGSNLVSRIMVSENIEDLEAKRFELNASLTNVRTQADRDGFKELVPGKHFVILPPGTSFEVQAEVGLFVVRGDAPIIAGAVLSGEHVLQVEVPTWPESNELAERLRYRWRQIGLLWSEPITSAPVPLTVEKHRKLVDCL